MFFHESVGVERKKNSGTYCIPIQYSVYLVIYLTGVVHAKRIFEEKVNYRYV